MSSPVQSKPSVFLSHTHADKSFARRLANDLEAAGARVWIDEAEIQVGDSLIEKIRDGIDTMDYVVVILSPDSVKSQWVRREVDIAMNQEIEGKRVKVLPLLYKQCDLPGFLKGKLYADFTDPKNYDSALALILRRLELSRRGQIRDTRRYDPYPFTDAPPRIRDLPTDAKHLLMQAADDDSQIIGTDWLETGFPPRLYRLKTSKWQVVVADSEHEARRWQTALETLEQRYLIQHVASRPGYKAYKLTPDGWDLAEFVRQVRG